MSNVKRRLVIGVLMIGSFLAGAAVTAAISATIIGGMGLVWFGTNAAVMVVGIAGASIPATMNALYTGDSATRLNVLTQLDQALRSQPNQQFDPQFTELLLPAIEHCESDSDPEVVEKAQQLAAFLRANTAPTPTSATPTP